MVFRKILVTSALPYANGDIHIGHLVEYIQTDIWVRFQRSRGHRIHYVGADDAHGTPIMIKAQAEGITPEQLVAEVGAAHQRDFNTFLISFDNYYTTHSPENRSFSEYIFNQAWQQGLITKNSINQAYDTIKQMFLPDRMIKGTCPNCSSPNQYGDNCEVCGSTYDPADLIDPRSALSNTKPVWRSSEHYFFDLPKLEPFLKEWTQAPNRLQNEITNKLSEWFEAGLKQWDISRDAPYFGFEIPATNAEKYFYVWVDAPIGYIASFKNLCQKQGLDFDEAWQADSDYELHHFIGKDIVYFHALFWPAMLKTAGLRLPTRIHAHGFLTVNGKKMSKSRGTFIRAKTWANHLAVEPLRYFLASRLSNSIDDLDLNLTEFRQKYNSDIVGKIVNIPSRCSGFLKQHFDNHLCPLDDQGQQLVNDLLKQQTPISNQFEQVNFSQAIRSIMELADQTNAYISDQAPWQIAKQIKQNSSLETLKRQQLHQILSTSLQCFSVLMIYLGPIFPTMTRVAEEFLSVPNLSWQSLKQNPLPEQHRINDFTPLARRIEQSSIDAMLEEEKRS